MAREFVFRCAITDLPVDGVSNANDALFKDENRHEAVRCLGRGRLHLVNPLSGRLASEHRPAHGPNPREDDNKT